MTSNRPDDCTRFGVRMSGLHGRCCMGKGLLIIDGADILDQGARGRLLKMVLNSGIPAIICMTLNKPDMAPDLSAAGAGVTYWVENGTCKPAQIFKPVAPGAVTATAKQPEASRSKNGPSARSTFSLPHF